MSVNGKDLGSGAVFLAIAAVYGGVAWRSLPIGQALSMGPGYFPLVLSGLIGLVGCVLVVRGVASEVAVPFFEDFSWRGLAFVSLAIAVFAGFINELGLFLAIAVATILCTLASGSIRPRNVAGLALGLALLCTLVFGLALRLPIPLIGSWFGG